jgi:Na+-driven multidrug efflux pump
MTNNNQDNHTLSLKHLFAFFLPLAGSALLVTLSHIIINSTLARSAHPEIVISSYAIAISLYAVLERPAIILRQTCSALVKDQSSLQAMWKTSFIVIGSILFLSTMIAYTPVGVWIFGHLFGVSADHMEITLDVYKVLMFVTLFSGVRCIFHGIIISNLKTKWMTIGMIIRLIGMALVAWYFISTGVKSGVAGAVIFLVGMAIECFVSMAEGIKLKKKLPIHKDGYVVRQSSHIFSFYRPLVYASLFAVTIGPLIYALLGESVDPTLAIASYTVALTVGTIFIKHFNLYASNRFELLP